jgi:hypothetical protein
LIRELHNLLRGHLSDRDFTLLVTDELPSLRQARTEEHLARCAKCRMRFSRFKDVVSQLVADENRCAESEIPHSREQRARLAARLNQIRDDVQDAEVVRREEANKPVGALFAMNPILITGLVLAVASVTCVFLWMEQMKPGITSNALLVRAEAWDQASTQNGAAGVICQTVTITTPKQTLRHRIYRDAQGKRKPKEQRMADDENRLRLKLAQADVVWDAPLSATNYQDWHDGQRVRRDQIERSSGHLLVLTTTTPNGTVAAQSLTVRDTDFHPVRRTISFRDSETVDIAEVDYMVLPWAPEASSLFQPEERMLGDGLARPQPAVVSIPPQPLTEEQLADAELSTRLTLDRLHADTGEQIEVVRGSHGIEVRGITDTEERKHQLEAQLDMLPHVTASISSMEQLKTKAPQPGDVSSVKVIETQSQATPLEIYYLAHDRDIAPLSDFAQKVFNNAFAINLESKAVEDLESRFSHDGAISAISSAALTDLLFTHKHKLLAALDEERQLLSSARIEAPLLAQTPPANNADLPLTGLAERNFVLTRELALDKGGSNRPATMIVSELVSTIDALNLQAHKIQVVPQKFTNLDKRK